MFLHYDIQACKHVCSPQLGNPVTTAAEHRLSTTTSSSRTVCMYSLSYKLSFLRLTRDCPIPKHVSLIQELHPVHGFSRNESYLQNYCSLVVTGCDWACWQLSHMSPHSFLGMQSVICILLDYSTLAPQW